MGRINSGVYLELWLFFLMRFILPPFFKSNGSLGAGQGVISSSEQDVIFLSYTHFMLTSIYEHPGGMFVLEGKKWNNCINASQGALDFISPANGEVKKMNEFFMMLSTWNMLMRCEESFITIYKLPNLNVFVCVCVGGDSLIDRAYFPFRNAFNWISLWKKLEDKWCVIYGARFSFRGWVKNVEEIYPLLRNVSPLYHNWVLSTVDKKRTWKVEVNLWNGFSLTGILNRLIIQSLFYSPTVLGQFICACFFFLWEFP